MNKDDVCKRLSDFIKCVRRKKNLTQEELALIVGASTKTVSRMEQNNGLKVFNSLAEIQAIASLGEVGIHEFIDFLLPDQDKISQNQQQQLTGD